MQRAKEAADLRALEISLHQAHIRSSREELDRLLAPDFTEFGSSGRAYDRPQIIAALLGETAAESPPAVHDFSVRFLSQTAALVTYRAVGEAPASESLRSSIWVHNGEHWQMAFHQGTPSARS